MMTTVLSTNSMGLNRFAIYLDSGANVHVFNLAMRNELTILDGLEKREVSTVFNTIESRVGADAFHDEFGLGRFEPEALTSVLSESQLMANGFRIQFDSGLGGTKLVSKGDSKFLFSLDDMGLFALSQPLASAVVASVVTLGDSSRVEKVVELHQAYGHPSESKMIQMARAGNFVKDGVTEHDVKAARLPDCRGCLTGKVHVGNSPQVPKSLAVEKEPGMQLNIDPIFFGNQDEK